MTRLFVLTAVTSLLLVGCQMQQRTAGGPAHAPAIGEALVETQTVATEAPIEITQVPEQGTATENNTENVETVEVADDQTPFEPAQNPTFGLARQLFQESDLRGARTAFTQALEDDLSYEELSETLETLDEINAQLFTSTDADGDMMIYGVQSGDSLGRIARKFGTTWQLLRRLNGLKSNTIRIGQKLMVPKGTLSLRVRKGQFALDMLLDGDFIKRYPIGTGKDGCTPEGEFRVKDRIPSPADGSYPSGHPNNRLGTHWMGVISDTEGYDGYGLHGCPPDKYDEIGTECSNGCLRLTNENIKELYEILPIGTRVVITG